MSGMDESNNLAEAVWGFIEAHRLILPDEYVIVAVSGGADSMALLEVLSSRAADKGVTLAVAHVDHCLREESAGDAQFVSAAAKRYGLEYFECKVDVHQHRRQCGQGIEQTARALRYEFLANCAEEWGAQKVAVAHHADDNVETILYRAIRGSHMRGLMGMPVSRRLAGCTARLIRPMLGARRRQIEAFCQARSIAWRTDKTNADTSYRRNFIRHELLPLLRERLNVRVDEAMLRLAGAAASTEHVLVDLAKAAVESAMQIRKRDQEPFSAETITDEHSLVKTFLPPFSYFDRQVLLAQTLTVQSYALRQILESAGAPMRELTAARLAEARAVLQDDGPGAVSIPGGWSISRQGEHVVVEASAAADPFCPAVPLGRGVVKLRDAVVKCEILSVLQVDVARHIASHPAGVELLDADKVQGAMTIRKRQDGDRFVPLGASGHRSVSDFLTDIKLPHWQRRQVWCICDSAGIIYLAPLRIDHRVRITPQTRRVLRIRLMPSR